MNSMYAFTMKNPLFNSLLFHSALLVFKMAFMMFITVYYRLSTNVVVVEKGKGKKEKQKENNNNTKTKTDQTKKGTENDEDDDPDIQRAKEVFTSDMECIFPFIIVALMYIAIDPLPKTCQMCFRIFTVSRYAHTFFHLIEIPEPVLILSYVPHTVILYMAYHISLAANGYF